MSKLSFFVGAVFLLQLFFGYGAADKFVICYYGTWATYRSGNGKFDVSHIRPELCTHAVYTFAAINDQGAVVAYDPWLDLPDNWGRIPRSKHEKKEEAFRLFKLDLLTSNNSAQLADNYGAFNALKQKNPQLKTLLAVGGWNLGSAKFSVMAASPALRQNFISSAVKMLQDHGFDGLDVDWEYPNRRDTVHGPADIDNFTQLLKELREEFDKHGLFLSAAVSSVREMASLSYDIPAISKYLDLINVMTYDMYGPWDPVTGHNAPLHRGEGDEQADPQDLYTLDVALQYWLDQGAPPEKLAVGVPFYGRTFTLASASNTGVRAPAVGEGIAGPYTATRGNIGYNEFCVKLQSESWISSYDSSARVPYAHSGRDWVSYDDAESITEKVLYATERGVAGIMIWSIETDDFHDLCGRGNFPLLRAVNAALGRDNITTTTTTTAPNHNGICKEEGLAADPEDCSSFYMCVRDKEDSLTAWQFRCPADLLWDQTLSMCNYADQVQCDA